MWDGNFDEIFESTKNLSERFGRIDEQEEHDWRNQYSTGFLSSVSAGHSPVEVIEEYDELPSRAKGFRNAVEELRGLGVNWTNFLRIELSKPVEPSMGRIPMNSGYQAKGVHRPSGKGIILESALGAWGSTYLSWVGPQESMDTASGHDDGQWEGQGKSYGSWSLKEVVKKVKKVLDVSNPAGHEGQGRWEEEDEEYEEY